VCADSSVVPQYYVLTREASLQQSELRNQQAAASAWHLRILAHMIHSLGSLTRCLSGESVALE
jgi:hypothetical protein